MDTPRLPSGVDSVSYSRKAQHLRPLSHAPLEKGTRSTSDHSLRTGEHDPVHSLRRDGTGRLILRDYVVYPIYSYSRILFEGESARVRLARSSDSLRWSHLEFFLSGISPFLPRSMSIEVQRDSSPNCNQIALFYVVIGYLNISEKKISTVAFHFAGSK